MIRTSTASRRLPLALALASLPLVALLAVAPGCGGSVSPAELSEKACGCQGSCPDQEVSEPTEACSEQDQRIARCMLDCGGDLCDATVLQQAAATRQTG
jgi:hypothetical protein